MTQFIFSLFFWTVLVSLANTQVCAESSSLEVLKSLKLNGLKCATKVTEDCSYQECLGQIGSYPRPILIVVPSSINSLRIHFHGHHLGLPQTLPYETSLTSMLNAFGLPKHLCLGDELTIFPQSLGKNITYKEFFKDDSSYTQFLNDLHQVLNQSLKDSPLNLSGHSGGGKYVAGALSAGLKVSIVTIFDGIYSAVTKEALKSWINLSEGKLTLATVKGMDPENFSNQIRKELMTKFTSTKSSINDTPYDVHSSLRVTHYSRFAGQVGGTKAHFDVLSEVWPIKN
jgi:hypothetical protein